MVKKKIVKKADSKPNTKTESAPKSKKEKREELKKMTPQKWIKQNIPMLVIGGVFIIIVMLVLSQNADGQTVLGAGNSTEGPVVEMIYFHLPTCIHCIIQSEFNDQLIEAYPNLRIVKYNMELRSSQEKLQEYVQSVPGLSGEMIGTPTTIVGEEYIIGFGSAETTGIRLSRMIDNEMARLEALEGNSESEMNSTMTD